MELILKENVAHLGFKDEIVDVKDGYGRNYLIPKGKAILATSSAKKVLAENLKQKAFKEKAIIDEANKLAKKIEKLEIKVKTKVGPDGKLFGSISNIDISNSLAENKIELEKENILIPGRTLKRVGKYEVTVRVHREVSSQLVFEIEPDEESIKLGLIIRPLYHICVLSPALIITKNQIDDLTEKLYQAISNTIEQLQKEGLWSNQK